MYAFTLTKKKIKTPFSYGIFLGILLVMAFFVRTLWINDIPAGIYPDEAVNGTDALTAWQTKEFHWFYENNNGREGLFINLIAISTTLFGNTVFGLKFWSILSGTLSVLGVYLLASELYASRRAGLIAGFLMTFSFWAINFSRISFRGILLPLILIFSFYFIFKGLRTKKYLLFIFSGLIFGLGFHTYIAFRIAPVILIVIFFALLLSQRRVIQTYWKHALLFLMSMLITTAPILYDFATHPEHLGSRSASISIFSPEVNDGNFLGTLTKTLTLSVAKYFVWGDQNWRHNLPPFPILDIITAFALAFGVLWSLLRWIHLLHKRIINKERHKEFLILSFLLSWFILMLAPEFLTNEGIPHALRSIGTQPPVFILAMLPFLWLSRQSTIQKSWKSAPFYVIVLLVLVALLNSFSYFFVWGNSPESKNAFDETFTQKAHYISQLPKERTVYVLPNGPGQNMTDGFPVSTDVIEYFNFYRSNLIFLTPETLLERPATFVLMRDDEQIFQNIENYFEGISIRESIPFREDQEAFTVIHIK